MSVQERRRIFNKMVAFVRQTNIRYKCLHIEKKHITDVVEATGKVSPYNLKSRATPLM